MFETGGDTQDQYNAETGASNDVITSTPNNLNSIGTSTTNSINTNLQQKIDHLEKENRNLQGRIRGYTTLGSLLQEEKEANRKLSRDFDELKKKLTDLDISPVNIPLDSDETRVETLRNSSPRTSMRTQNSLTAVTHMEEIDQTEPNRHDHDEQDMNPDPQPRSISREVIPLQESMHDDHNDLSELAANPSMSVSEPPHSQIDNINIGGNLQLDSDRFEDPQYEKAHPSTTLAQRALSPTASMTSSQKYSFPSLNSLSGQNVTSGDLGRTSDFNVMVSCSEPPSLGHQVGRVANMLSSSHTSVVANRLRQISDEVDKQERDLIKYKRLNETLCEEIKMLKTSKYIEVREEKSKSYQLRAMNQILETRVRELEAHQGQMANSLTQQGWVDIGKTLGSKTDVELFQNAPATLPTDVNTLTDMVQELTLKNKKLKDANNSWQERWNQLETSKTNIIKSLEKRLEGKNDELRKMFADNEKKLLEFEQMMTAAKDHSADEENAKEEALQQLHITNISQNKLKEKVTSLENDNAELVRAKHAIEAEVSVLKKQIYKPQASSQPGETIDSLKTEIAVLRQQLTVFEEDFERERQDRATTQSARDDLQKKYDLVVRSKRHYAERLTNLQQKCDHLESELSQARRRSQTFENENRRIKIELKQQQQAAMQFQPPVIQPFQQAYPQYHTPYVQAGYFQPAAAMTQTPIQGFSRSQVPLEHLPGAWTCKQCTFVNIPERTVCDMCGTIRQRTQSRLSQPETPGSNPEATLMSRGRDVPDNDLVTDNDLAMDNGQF